MSVVPDPPNGSRTISRLLDELRMARSTSATWIGVHVALDDKQSVELVLIKPGKRQIEADGPEVAEFKLQQFFVPVDSNPSIDCLQLHRLGTAPPSNRARRWSAPR